MIFSEVLMSLIAARYFSGEKLYWILT